LNGLTAAAPWDEQDWDDQHWDQRTGRLAGPAPARHTAPPARGPARSGSPRGGPARSGSPRGGPARSGPAQYNPAQRGPAQYEPARSHPAPAAARPLPPALASLIARLWAQRTRLTIFGLNGTAVFAAGLMIQIILVQYAGVGHVPSYIVQTLASIQLSFLLSRYLTWRDRSVSFGHGLIKFNAQQLAVTGLGMAGYAILEGLGMNYVLANVLVTGLLTPVSFASSHLWSLRPHRTAEPELSPGVAPTRPQPIYAPRY
jgi:putative flippase GtrA